MKWTPAIQISELVVLIFTMLIIWNQLDQQAEQIEQHAEQVKQQAKQIEQQAEQLNRQADQHQLDRLIAWKTSIQGINGLIMQNPETFIPVLYPDEKNLEKAKRLTATYASLHALEVIYYMRKDEEYPPDQLTEFLRSYVAGDDFKELWSLAAYRAAFTKEFQQQLNDILGP